MTQGEPHKGWFAAHLFPGLIVKSPVNCATMVRARALECRVNYRALGGPLPPDVAGRWMDYLTLVTPRLLTFSHLPLGSAASLRPSDAMTVTMTTRQVEGRLIFIDHRCRPRWHLRGPDVHTGPARLNQNS